MQVIVRRQDQKLCASITCMIRHYVARRAKVIFDHPHNAAYSAFGLGMGQPPTAPFGLRATATFSGLVALGGPRLSLGLLRLTASP